MLNKKASAQQRKTINQMKRPSTKWEMIFANNISSEEFISKIHKELKQLNTKKKKKKNPIKKTEQRL